MSDALPRGWEWCTVDKIARYVTSGSRDWSKFYSKGGAAYFVRSAEINDYSFRLSEAIRVNLPASVEGKRTLIESGDILVTITGANVGKCAKVDGGIPEAYVSQSVALIKVADVELTPFVYFALRAPNIGGKQLGEMTYGVGRPVLSLPQIRSIQVPLAPVAEQHRIVATLQQALSKIDGCQKRLAKASVLLTRVRRSVLAAACSGRLTADWRVENTSTQPVSEFIASVLVKLHSTKGREDSETLINETELPELPETWEWHTLNSLTLRIGDVDHRMPKATAKGVPYVSTKDFCDGNGIDFQNAKRISREDYHELCRKIEPQKGDILLSRYGTIGEVRLVESGEQFQASYSIAIVKSYRSEVLTKYLALCLRSHFLQRQMSLAVRASSQPDIGLKHIRGLLIPVPPPEEQREIVHRAEQLFGFASQIQERVAAAQAHVNELTSSILSKAFRGELVRTEADVAHREERRYETACELLDRIKRDRAQSVEQAASKRKAHSKANGSRRLRRKVG